MYFSNMHQSSVDCVNKVGEGGISVVEVEGGDLRLYFDARPRLEFRGAKVIADAGLLAAR